MNKSNFNSLSYKILLIAVLICSRQIAISQTDLSSIDARFKDYSQAFLQEKQYVHTDRNFYLAGETVWFKIYNVDASFHQPMDLSKVAYVEILDAGHKPVLQTKVSLKEGVGIGSITLPDDVSSGNYLLRSYTNWMKNFGADYFFEKTISIVNTLRDGPVKENKQDSAAIDIQFFPEGGNLVKGLKSKVAFRAIDQSGKGLDFAGVIVDANNDTIVRFSPAKFGIGNFELTPTQQNYKAVITYDGSHTVTRELPNIFDQGVVLSLSESGDKIEVGVQATISFENLDLQLFTHTRNTTGQSLTATVKNSAARFVVDKKNLGEGVSHFTLFSNKMQPLCERLYFKQPERKLFINANTTKQLFDSREKISIDVDVQDEKGSAKNADLSVAVYLIDSTSTYNEDILSYLLLSSDLRGTIESPSYYLQNNGDVKTEADNLMLTHGWRRFKWEQVLAKDREGPKYLPELEGPIVSAKVTDAQSGSPVPQAKAYLSIPGRKFQFYSGLSDGSGNVDFYTKGAFGLNELVAQPEADKNYRVDVQTPFFEEASSRVLPAFNYTGVGVERLQAMSVNMQVENIFTADKTITKSLEVDTTIFYGKAMMNYQLDDYVRFPTMEEVLREYVREINVYKQNKSFSIGLMKKQPTGIVDRKNPLVLLDGVPIFDANKLMAYDPLKIKELQTIENDYYLGKLYFEGLVSFRTYTGRPEGLQTDSKATITDYEGLQLQREFYSPVYNTEKDRSSRLPDFRNLLYWQPQLKTAAKKQTIEFYSSDLAGQYLVVVQGLSADGRAGSKTIVLNVSNTVVAGK